MNASPFNDFLEKWRRKELEPFTVNGIPVKTAYLVPCALLATFLVVHVVVSIAKLIRFHANKAFRKWVRFLIYFLHSFYRRFLLLNNIASDVRHFLHRLLGQSRYSTRLGMERRQ